MPLSKGSSEKIIARNIAELHSGKTYSYTKEKFGQAKANRQAIAIALSKARESKGGE